MVASGGEGKPKPAIGARQDVNRALFTALEERGRRDDPSSGGLAGKEPLD
jgi:hypothetical protein